MYCNSCGANIADNSPYCSQCGAATATAAAPTGVVQPRSPPGLSPPPYRVPPPGGGPETPTEGKATASLVCGILSVTFFPILASIPAIILGHMARGSIKRSMGKLKGEGLA